MIRPAGRFGVPFARPKGVHGQDEEAEFDEPQAAGLNDRVAPGAGLVPIASRTAPLATGSPEASVTLTWTAGEIALVAQTPAGGWVANLTSAGARLGMVGDQVGPASVATLSVSRVCPEPSAFIT